MRGSQFADLDKEQVVNVFEWQAKVIERSAEAVAYWVETTPEDKLNWKPEGAREGTVRTITEQMQECVGVNNGFAALLRGEKRPSRTQEENGITMSSAEIQASLKSSAGSLAAVVRGMQQDQLTELYDVGWAKIPGAILLELAVGNMMYHGGQINYIQLLYGDTDFHFPADFFQWEGVAEKVEAGA